MSWAKREPKYLTGPKIVDIHELVHRIQVGAYTMINGKPTHAAVLRNQTLATLVGWVRGGWAHEVRLNPAFPQPEVKPAPVSINLPF